MPTYVVTFKVRGSGAFPLDMLRYDACHPTRPDDVSKLMFNFTDDDYHEQRTVQLKTYLNTSKKNAERLVSRGLTPSDTYKDRQGRWASFGWHVVEKELLPARGI